MNTLYVLRTELEELYRKKGEIEWQIVQKLAWLEQEERRDTTRQD